MHISKEEINALTLNEKQQLLDMIWDSFDDIDNDNPDDSLGAETMEELELLHERLAEVENDPSTAIHWERAIDKLRKRR